MLTCQRCGSERVLHLHTHSRDCHFATFMDVENDGYAPKGLPFCDGDDAWFEVCLKCGQLQGEWPYEASDEDIKNAVRGM